MLFFLAALGVLLLGGLLALCSHRSPRLATFFGVSGAVLGCALGLVDAFAALGSGATEFVRVPWSVPGGSFYVALDPLSAFFLLPILGLSALCAWYGGGYLWAQRERKSLGAPWFFFNLLVASMALTVVARNAVLFLTAWEVMTLASFFLVTFEDEKEGVQEAGWTYLVAAQVGVAFLLALFVLLGRDSGSLDFDRFSAGEGLASTLFLLAVAGFGLKAGFIPFHVWLPEAHPAAPSHVSALLSGVMIKTGIYGLVRTLTFLGPPPAWWGWMLVGLGVTSGVLGVLFALAQHDLKRLLAYHSVENIGIIALGLGVGLLGLSHGSRELAVLGFAGGLLHVLNHALFKGLLFLGAGAVQHATGTRELDHLGGLLKKMPWTGLCFLVGAAAISGLPPLNGFVSELLIFLGAFKGLTGPQSGMALPLLSVVTGLALIGGLAAACFAKAFGIVFLGTPRREHAEEAEALEDPGPAMRWPMAGLALACVLVGLCAPFVLARLAPAVAQATGLPRAEVAAGLVGVAEVLTWVSAAALVFFVFLTLLIFLRRRLLAGRPVEKAATWGCGYARPTSRMQYTASSFARPLTALFDTVLGSHRRWVPPAGLFPAQASLATETPDRFREGLYVPFFRAVDAGLARFRWLQHGRVQLYVLYIAVTLVVLLVWKLG